MKKDILIDVAMVTYNHEKYIAQAIKSVLSQKTSFSVRLIIGEDASTDATSQICRSYADQYPDQIVLLQTNKNLGLVKNYEQVFEQCTGKYVAILEGDDYWIDERKLQKQAEMLEADAELGIVHSPSYVLNEDSGKLTPPSKKRINTILNRQGFIYNILIQDNFIVPLTVLFRRDLLTDKIDYNFLVKNNVQTIDYSLWLGMSIHSKVGFLEDIVGVYRVLSTSISNSHSIKKQESFYETVKLVGAYYLNSHPIEGFTIKDLEDKINEWLFSRSISLMDYKAAKLYGALISSNSIKMQIIWSHVKARIKENVMRQYHRSLYRKVENVDLS
jgi:glycosyltransferase involved in cell wall biosynthesis